MPTTSSQAVLLLTYIYVYPLVLVASAVFRGTILSFFYLVGFLLALFCQPDALLRRRKLLSVGITLAMLGLSLAVLLTESVLWLCDSQGVLPTSEAAQEYLPWIIGYYSQDVTTLQYFQMLLPDSLVALTSVVMLLLLALTGFKHPNLREEARKNSSVSTLLLMLQYGSSTMQELRQRRLLGRLVAPSHQYLSIICCLLAGVLFSSCTTFLYLTFALLAVVFVGIGFSIEFVSSMSWPFVLAFTGLDIMYMYLAQFEYGNGVNISPVYVSGVDGAVQWMQYETWEWADMWYIFAEFALLVIIFYMGSFRFKMHSVGKRVAKELAALGTEAIVMSGDEEPEGALVLAPPSKERVRLQLSSIGNMSPEHTPENPGAKKFFASYGWQLSFFFFMLSCCLTPSLLQLPVLIVVMFGATLLPSRVLKLTLMPMLLYSALFLVAQALYCIPFPSRGESDVLANLGFVVYDPVLAYLGMQTIPIFLLAISWHNIKYGEALRAARMAGTEREPLLFQQRAGKVRWQKSKERITLAGKIVWHMFLKQAYLISLLAVMLCSLSSVNLFNLFYLIFFTTFFVSRKAAHRLWILLVLYTEVVILVEFVWQLSWTEGLDGNTVPELFGLEHFNVLLRGIAYHVAIWVFAVIQLWIVRALRHEKKKKKLAAEAALRESLADVSEPGAAEVQLVGSRRAFQRLDLPPRLEVVKEAILDALPTVGLALCYLVFGVVALVPEYDVVKMIYLGVAYVCLLLHMVFRDAVRYIRWFWPGVVVIALSATLALYFYQFPQVASWLQDLWPEELNGWVSLSDLGLHQLDDWEQYLALLGSSLVFVASVLQLRSFILYGGMTKESVQPASSVQGVAAAAGGEEPQPMQASDHWPLAASGIALAKRAMVLHMYKVTLIALWLTACSSINILDLGFALLAVWGPFFRDGANSVGIFIMVYAQLCTYVSYLVEFDGLNRLLETYVFPDDTDGTRYANFLDYLGVEADGDLFLEVAFFNIVILLLIVERIANRWKDDPDIKVLETSTGEPCPLFLVSKEHFEGEPVGKLDADSPLLALERLNAVRFRLMWYASNFYRLFGIIVFTMSLLLTIFLRVNVWSVFEIFLVGACVVAPTAVKRASPILLLLLGTLLIWEYMSYLGLPAGLWEAPWSSWDQEDLAWLTLGGDNYNFYLTVSDYVTMVLLGLIFRMYYFYYQPTAKAKEKERQREKSVADQVEVDVDGAAVVHYPDLDPLGNPLFTGASASDSEREYLLDDPDDLDDAVAVLASTPENLAAFQFDTLGDRVLYYALRYSLHVIMVCVFMFATVQANLLSCGYVIFSLFFLYYDEILYEKRNKVWNWIRAYNFFVLFLQICFQCPFVPEKLEPYSAQQIIGLYKYDNLAAVFSATGVIFDIVIFIFVTIQAAIFDTQIFVRIAIEVVHQRDTAIVHARKRHKEFVEAEQEAEERIFQEKEDRRHRLEGVRQFREQKLYLHSESSSNLVARVASEDPLPVPPAEETPGYEEIPDGDVQDPKKQREEAIRKQKEEEEEELEVHDLSDVDLEKESEESDDGGYVSEDEEDLKEKVKKKVVWALETLYAATVSALFSIGGRDPDPEMNRAQTLALGVYYLIVIKSHYVCYFLFVIDNMVYASMLSQLFVFITFGYALLERPQPARSFWRWLLFYVNLMLILKFVFQISVFCVCYASFDWYLWCVEPLCSNPDYCDPSYMDDSIILKDLPRTFGIEKIDGVFMFGVAFDLIVLVLLLIHRTNMKVSGNWLFLTQLWEEGKVEYYFSEKERKEEKKKEKAEKKAEKREKKRIAALRKHRKKLRQERAAMVEAGKTTERMDAAIAEVTAKLHGPPPPPVEKKSTIKTLFDKLRRKNDDGEEKEEEVEVRMSDVVQAISSSSSTVATMASREGPESLGMLSGVVFNVKYYYHNLFRQHATATDYYVPMIIIEALAFGYMLLCQNQFTYQPPSSWTFILLENSVPTSFFFLLLIQFLLIVMDRVIYLFRSVRCKVAMQYLTLVYYTAIIFYVLPEGHEEEFQDELLLIVFYLMKCVYWWLSALQIADGYPPNIQRRWLTKNYSQPMYYIYQGYMLVPFLFEMRSLLDWTVHETTLTFLHWMKLEDIYSSLYMTKCKREKEKKENFFEKRGLIEKVTQGLAVFVGLVFLLWFPLFLLSSANPATYTNGVTALEMEISVVGWEPLYSIYQDQDIVVADDDQFDTIRDNFSFVSSDEESDTQIVTIAPYSGTIWAATPPSQYQLEKHLLNSTAVNLQLRYTFHRPAPVDQQIVSGEIVSQPLTELQRIAMYEALALDHQVDGVVVPAFMPRIFNVKLDGTVTVEADTSNYLGIILSLNRTIANEEVLYSNGTTKSAPTYTEFWTVMNSQWNQTYVDDSDQPHPFPQIIIISDEVPAFFSASLAASGIIGIYLAIVLVVGQFLRGYVSDLQTKIIFTEMPEPIDLLTMCEDIFTAREDGDLVLERELFNELIELYRSPESLIAVTQVKQKQD